MKPLHVWHRLWPFYTEDARQRVSDLICRGATYASADDPVITELESALAALHCPGGFAVYCNSGTSALFSAYFGLGLDPGAEVVVASNSFRGTVTPLLLLNLKPIFADADSATGAMNLVDAESRITSRTQAIVITHLWGQPTDPQAARRLAAKYSLALIEDASHAHGCSFSGRPLGSFGDVAALSCGTKKMVSGGMGGILLTRDRRIYERAMLLGQAQARTAGAIRDPYLRQYLGTGLGANLRGTPIAAALALDHVARLSTTIAIKNHNLSQLQQLLRDRLPILTPIPRSPSLTSGAWYSFNCTLDTSVVSRPSLLAALSSRGIRVSAGGYALHREPLFQAFNHGPTDTPPSPHFPGTEALAATLITWDTREFYEKADAVLAAYSASFEEVAAVLKTHPPSWLTDQHSRPAS